jgi:hypothetical protein
MGSKTPFSCTSHRETLRDEDSAARPAPAHGSAANLLLRRIADALQVPTAVLYNLPDARDTAAPAEAERPGAAGDFGGAPNTLSDTASGGDFEDECVALLRAYRGIRDPEERRRLLTLVRMTAGRT